MTIRVNFDIPMPNQPYVDDFSDGNTHSSVYTGFRYIKFQYDNDTRIVADVIAMGDTVEECDENQVPCMENHSSSLLNCEENPLIASIITRQYETGDVADYTEDLGTTDADGNAETWTYYWNDETGCLSQIYKRESLVFNSDGTFTGPAFRIHALTAESFNESITQGIANCDAELAREGVYNTEEAQAITDHKNFLSGIATKYAGVSHWKIPFPNAPEFK